MHQKIEKMIEIANKERERRVTMYAEANKAVYDAEYLRDRYPEFAPGNDYHWPEGQVAVSSYGGYVELHIYHIESLKHDLINILDDMISLGYDPSKFVDSHDGDSRTFQADKLHLVAWLKPDSPKCKKILKESRTSSYTDNEYAIVCLD